MIFNGTSTEQKRRNPQATQTIYSGQQTLVLPFGLTFSISSWAYCTSNTHTHTHIGTGATLKIWKRVQTLQHFYIWCTKPLPTFWYEVKRGLENRTNTRTPHLDRDLQIFIKNQQTTVLPGPQTNHKPDSPVRFEPAPDVTRHASTPPTPHLIGWFKWTVGVKMWLQFQQFCFLCWIKIWFVSLSHLHLLFFSHKLSVFNMMWHHRC